jgi:hypothetical protein
MSRSPQMSIWFREYQQRNCRLAPRTVKVAGEPAIPLGRPRGFAPGGPQKRFTEPERETIINLLQIYPRSPATVAQFFAEAWPGHSITPPTIHKIKCAAIKAGKLKL